MRILGIRVAPKCIYFSVIESNDVIDILTVDSIHVPKALDVPRSLSFIRTTIISIIQEYGITKAGMKVYEGNAQNTNPFRLNIEGVILELLANSSVENYFEGYISSIAKRLESKPQEIKAVLDGEQNPLEIPGWSQYKKEQREAILTGLATLF
ncbi:hypothetical protein [Bacillus pacificus]|uniref:hypothetical protein n=1 Tax=Bacillus pacificus TaxID=2026187 RepID=UPI00397F3E21